MATKVEKSIEVAVPIRTAYDQWTQFEEFPQFMGGVQEVRQTSDTMTHWVIQAGGVKREWDAAILEQVPDTKVAWAATSGATNAGAVQFTELAPDRTLVHLTMEYEPEGLVEKAGDALGVIERRAKADLEKFKEFIEARGVESGGWRGGVQEGSLPGAPGVEAAAASRGDDGSAGVTGTAVAGAAVLAAGAAVAGVAAAKARSEGQDEATARPTATGTTASTAAERTIDLEPPVRTTAGTEGAGRDATGKTDLPGDGEPIVLDDDPVTARRGEA